MGRGSKSCDVAPISVPSLLDDEFGVAGGQAGAVAPCNPHPLLARLACHHAGKRGDERKRSSCAMGKTALPWESVPGRREVHEKSAGCWLAALERARDLLLLLVLARGAFALQRDIQGRYDGGPKASAYRARIIKDSLDRAAVDRAASCRAMALRCDYHAPEWLPSCRGELMHS
ncbi:unnamed protein product [Clonostachys byssicola]|uniref:Uncharacterized protein n=1 Tax=Clonostachys byssicola TaxID=160290 RepID=A0A9N9UFK0_9HYPO|nr:unnamed protein product [Clonostachys byssicola]